MLKLREPIQLKSARGLSLLSTRELGALAGNYDMTQSAISPSSLMLLFSPQSELPEDMGGSSSISIRRSSTDVRNITLSVVNNLLNTIALNQHNDFTYQDRVHITSMLRTLGIENVQQFMEQVQLLRQEHQSISQLLTLYHNETVQQYAGSRTQNETYNRHDSHHSTVHQGAEGGSRYYLHNDIYHRLQTGDIYQELHAHQTVPSMPHSFVNNLQLRLSEQLRVSNHLQLNELRSRTVTGSRMTLHHHQNSYETGELLPPPTTEREVLQQAATAMLLTTVDNLFTQRFNAHYANADNWVNVAEQLEQTAYNTLSRFESYHSGQTFTYSNDTQYTQSQLAIYNTEATLLRQLIRGEQQTKAEGAATLQSFTQAGDTYIEHRVTQQGEETPAADSEQITEGQSTTERVTSQITDITRQLLQGTGSINYSATGSTKPIEPLQELTLSQLAQLPPQEVSEEVLIQQLDAIDHKNREMLTRLQERTEVLRREVIAPQSVDPSRMRADALRAITEPEKLFAELRERPEVPMQHTQSPAAEAMLELATPEVRALLQTVTQYANNPQAQLAALHTATPMDLHRDTQQVMQATREIEQVERELLQTTVQVEQQQTVQQSLQEWTQAMQIQPLSNHPQGVPPVPFVHKTERKAVEEELLELLEQQRTSRTEVVHEEQEHLQVNTLRETNQTTLNQQFVTQSTEEVTELVNRALTRQMGTITDKVYSQMERKLQMERNRRGRF